MTPRAVAAEKLSVAGPIEVSVVMPCLNEQDTIGPCVESALAALREHGMAGEVIVCDNGSTDDSIAIAQKLGARVVTEAERRYGAAYMTGISAARGRLILIADSDSTYDFGDLPRLLEPPRQGYDLALRPRFKGKILTRPMPCAN